MCTKVASLTRAANQYFTACVLSLLYVTRHLLERRAPAEPTNRQSAALVTRSHLNAHDRPNEVGEVGRRTDFELRHLLKQLLLEAALPYGGSDVDTG